MTSHCTQKAFTSEHKPQALFVAHSAEQAGHGYDWSRRRRWINWNRCRRWIKWSRRRRWINWSRRRRWINWSRHRRWISLTMIIVSSIMFFTAGFIAAFTAAFIVAFIVAPEI